jgi:hypothetical protein
MHSKKHGHQISQEPSRVLPETVADRAARQTAAATIWIAVFTCALFFLNGVTIAILVKQLGEMHSGGLDTHDLAEEAKKQSSATKSLAEAARVQSENTAVLAAATKDQVTKLNAQWKVMQSQLTFAQDEARAEQRAWLVVGIEFPNIQRDPVLHDVVNIYGPQDRISNDVVSLSNAGKSPAFEIRVTGWFEILNSADASSFGENGPYSIFDASSLFPGGVARGSIQLFRDHKEGKFTNEEVKAFVDDTSYLIAYGVLVYRDDFGTHWQRFCHWTHYGPRIAGGFNIDSCIRYNQFGDGNPPERSDYRPENGGKHP